ncbi:Ubiquitin domain-containing protein [Rhynchospora pubera]|uniref:Ubiquitin domain-containing protein n=1 Tax=Rhynchospora pubera TaxID=906938 RepID=A0AAV8GU30_9POAL|nr:Ubiquitin domain-containing protein [Rhynchospora pubera]
MGCAGSTPSGAEETPKKLRKPKPWKHTEAITVEQLRQMRDEFWDTSPHYGGRKEIWDALKAATEADLSLAQAIIDSAGIIVSNPDLSLCYDALGTLIYKNFMVLLLFFSFANIPAIIPVLANGKMGIQYNVEFNS